MIYEALEFAKQVHNGQKRKDNGKPYLTHLTRVAGAVMSHPMCTKYMVVAALLHDSLEDHPDKVTPEIITARFGGGVTALVQELTNVSKDSKEPRAKRKAMDRSRLAKVSNEAKVIKLCDRIDNLSEVISDFKSASEDRRKFFMIYAKESELLNDAIGDVDDLLRIRLCDLIQQIRFLCK